MLFYDNQTAITLGRVGGRPRWHPTFLTPRPPLRDRPPSAALATRSGGKVERPFR
jgi:hypothetical protein